MGYRIDIFDLIFCPNEMLPSADGSYTIEKLTEGEKISQISVYTAPKI